MRILLRTSNWAIWARRLGSFALPLTIIPVLMHRAHAVSTETFAIIEAVAVLVALAALVASIGAFSRIWVTGDLGWGRAMTGLVFSLLCLLPLGLLTGEYVLYPMVDEVSTERANPPPLLSGAPFTPLSEATQQRIATAFPNVKNRSYPLPAGQIFTLVDKLAVERGWDVRRRRQPTAAGDDGQLNAIATTLLGLRDEVSIRVAQTTDGSLVAMRAASVGPFYEPGSQGARIEEFLGALDGRVTLLMKDEPAGSSGEDETDAPADQSVVPAPAPRGKRH
ncbi:MAG: DUF1499 domain-containing protein [Devosia sp.]|nr:DUF1499 domain-containing protein [Devosia sp.]